jgi:WS/DGAT/MGAT family acyltransferase
VAHRKSKIPRVERVSSGDLRELASEHAGAAVQVGAVLVLDARLDPAAVRDAIGERIRGVPRLRQRLVRPPFGGGRPLWVDDPDFDLGRHVGVVLCPAPGDETALLAVAAGVVTRRLPADRPLWSVTLVTALPGGRTALIMTLHHVVADGVGGLAVLAQLVDGAPAVPGGDFPRPAPSRRDLFRDAAGTRLRTLIRSAAGAGSAGSGHPPGEAGLAEGAGLAGEAGARSPGGLGPGGGGRLAGGVRWWVAAVAGVARSAAGPPRSSLNKPTGPHRRFAVARVDLAAVRRVSHAHGATVNDVVLTAVSGALRAVLRDRGESVDRFVISVPVSARRDASAARLGNQVAIMMVPVLVAGDPYRRLSAIARTTRDRKRAASRGSAALLGLAFRALAGFGVMRWFVDRQRLITTFVTNLRGPDARLSFLAVPITGVIPVSSISGNVTVAFAALSYAGVLVVTVVADPRRCPDLPALVTHLQGELDRLTAGGVT